MSCLALLAQNTFPKPSLIVGVQSITLLLVFVTVFYFYLTMTILLRWAPSFLDCFLPFAIASFEIPPAFFLGNATAWNAWLAALWLATTGGLWITKNWSPPSHFGADTRAHRKLHQLLRELQLTGWFGGLGAAVCAFLAHHYPDDQLWWGIGGTGAILATVGMVVARTELRVSQIHAHYGVNRPPFN